MTVPTVLVVGAGPVGLTMTADLLQQGIDVRLVTDAIATDAQSRAIVMWPRSLELLRRLGISERLIAAGHRIGAVRFYVDGRELARARLSALPDTDYPY